MTDAVVVGDVYTSLVKRVQDCLREDKLSVITSERSCASFGDCREKLPGVEPR